MTLLTVAQARMRITTDLDDTDLAAIIADEQAMLVARLGAVPDGATAITETHYLDRAQQSVYLHRPVLSVTTVTEAAAIGETAATLTASQYTAISKQGRLIRLDAGATWGAVVTVTYVPEDQSAKWRAVLIELVRLAIEQTAMQAESVAGEYSYTAPNWNEARARLYRRLQFPIV